MEPENHLSYWEKKLLQRLQEGLPLEPRPFKRMAEEMGCSEEEILEKIEDMKARKIIRRFGGIWDSARLGFFSQLVALRVQPGSLEEVAGQVSCYPGVTHNYQRDHYFNLWFTLTAGTKQEMENTLKEINSLPGVEQLLELPALRRFKTAVKFRWDDTHAP